MHMQMRNRIAVDRVVQLDRTRDLLKLPRRPAADRALKASLVCSKLVQLHRVALQDEAAVSPHRTIGATCQIRCVQLCNNSEWLARQADRTRFAAAKSFPFRSTPLAH